MPNSWSRGEDEMRRSKSSAQHSQPLALSISPGGSRAHICHTLCCVLHNEDKA